jgi:P27 family predicted phage terminase small subunit
MGARGRKSATELAAPPVRLVEPAKDFVELLPEPPDHLSDSMRAWWRETVKAYALEPHHLKLLEAAADAWDRMAQARTTLLADGLTVATGDGGRKAHPCAAIERDARSQFMVALRELDLDEPLPSPGAYRPPPAIRSNRRRG